MVNETEYQGWANYETWAVNLWLTDNEGEVKQWDKIAEENRNRCTLADLLKEDYQDKMPALPNVWGDLLGAALSEVDWYQVADALLEDYVPEEGETSSGSCLLEDIVEGIKDLIPEDMLDEFELYDPDDTDDDDARMGIFEEICDYLDEIAPEGLRFGARKDNSTSFGFWKVSA